MLQSEVVARFWNVLKQRTLSFVGEEVGPLTPRLEQLIRVWEVLRIEEHVRVYAMGSTGGRPLKDRRAVARSFVAKSFLNIPTTTSLIERLRVDTTLRRLCGFERRKDVPSEATFSRAFGEFATTELGQRTHAALVAGVYGEGIVGHASRDATAIAARERLHKKGPHKKEAKQHDVPRRRGRPKKGEVRPIPEPTRLEKQSVSGATLKDMLAELPKDADIGAKRNAKGFMEWWRGYKLHLDVADTGMPLSAILSSASLHDTQAAIPLMKMTAERVGTVLYEVMDSAYDVLMVRSASQAMGRIPILESNPRRSVEQQEAKRHRAIQRALGLPPLAEELRYNERTTVERAYARLKEEFGARNVRVRGHAKVMAHLMFGVCVLGADSLLRLVA